MNRVGFIAALPAESRSLYRRGLGFDGVAALPGGHCLTVSGTGPENARRAALRLLDEGVVALVSWGCAAALAPSLKPGDLAVPERILGTDGRVHTVDAEWRGRFVSALTPTISPVAGTLAESPEIVPDPAAKKALHSATGAEAVDMESAAIARVAEARGLPFLAVRAIADSASMRLPHAVMIALTPRGDVRLAILLSQLLRHPGQLGELLGLGRAFGMSMAGLRLARSLAGESFCLPAVAGGCRSLAEPR